MAAINFPAAPAERVGDVVHALDHLLMAPVVEFQVGLVLDVEPREIGAHRREVAVVSRRHGDPQAAQSCGRPAARRRPRPGPTSRWAA